MKQILLLGDIHGEFETINRFFKKNKLTNVELIQLGDFGVGFFYNDNRNKIKEERRLKLLNDYLGKRNSHLYVVRGNHDDPKFFDGTRTEYENITFLVDYETFNINYLKFLPIGGGISIDRGPTPYENNGIGRYQGVSWWEDEKIRYTEADKEKVLLTKGVDVIISHNAPDFAPPIGIGKIVPRFALYDETLIEEVLEERALLTKIWEDINLNSYPTNWFYGHFHRSDIMLFDYQCNFICLDIDEFYELKQKKMQNEDFIKGIYIIGKNIPEDYRTDYNVVTEHDQFWIGRTEWVKDEQDIKILNEMGWFEDEGMWSCFT